MNLVLMWLSTCGLIFCVFVFLEWRRQVNCQNFLKSIEGMWLVKNMEHLGQLYRLAGETHPCECAQCEELKEAINKLQKECEEVYAKLVELRNNVKF